MQLSETSKVPLHRRELVVAEAQIDTADFAEIGRYRWLLNSNGYAVRMVPHEKRYRAVLMHRQILGLVHGDGVEVDHINHDKLDNRRTNLRVGSHAANAQNSIAQRRARSPYRAVFWDSRNGRPWRARPRVNGRYIHLGRFATELEAALAVEAFRREHTPLVEPDPLLMQHN